MENYPPAPVATTNATKVPETFLLDIIKTKAPDLLKAGLGMGVEFGKKFLINMLNDYGIADFRDETIQAIEKLNQEIQIIKTKIDQIDKKIDIVNAETYINKIYAHVDTIQTNLKPIFTGGMKTLMDQEALIKDDKDAAKAEQDRVNFYKTTFENKTLIPNGGIVANYITEFANTLVRPNDADDTAHGNLFTYYDLTLGKNNKWTYQEYTNKREFINKIATTLLVGTTVAKYDLHYRAKGADEATLKTYEQMAKAMDEAVQGANKLFQKELLRLDKIEERRQKEHIETYLPTGKEYKNRLATLTFNLDDKTGNQAILVRNDGTARSDKNEELVYHPDQNLIKDVNNDFIEYKAAYKDKNYTINDYLKDAGFYANDAEKFNKAAGLYNGNLYQDWCGLYHHDTEITATYYDQNGNYQRKPIYKVNVFHDWMGNPNNYRIDNLDNNYYFAFIENDKDGKEQLVGCYQQEYFYNDYEQQLTKQFYYHINQYITTTTIPAYTNGKF